MSVGMVAAGVGAVSGLMNAGAAEDAANAQIQSTERANATMESARRENAARMQPWVTGGGLANNALMARLGLGSGRSDGGENLQSAQLFTRDANGRPTYNAALYSTNQAYKQAWDELSAEHGAKYNNGYEATSDTGWIDQRLREKLGGAMNGPVEADPLRGSLLKQFDQSDLDSDLVYQNGLQFGLKTGTDQLNNRAAASGGYGSGAALKALTRFGNDYATTKTAGAYDRNMQGKQQTYNFLSGQSAQGQNAAAGVGATGMSAAGTIGNNQIGAGNAQASGIVGSANALSSGLAGATNAYQWNQMMGKPATNTGTGLQESWEIPMQPGGGY